LVFVVIYSSFIMITRLLWGKRLDSYGELSDQTSSHG